VRDTADAAVRFYETPSTRGRVVNVASGRETTINVLVDELCQALGADVPVTHEPSRMGDVRRHCGSVDLALELIGYRPQTTLHDGLKETVAWYQETLPPATRR
jgi:UDP-glucose 4-epimerase